MRHSGPAARAIRNSPAPMTTAPMARDALTGRGETLGGDGGGRFKSGARNHLNLLFDAPSLER
jgi:hypothetical protein